MGSIIGSAMKAQMKEQMEVQAVMQRNMLERQIQMQMMMRERQMSMQIARGRELLNWYASFSGIAILGALAGFRRSKNPAMLSPILPLAFITAYQWDMCYNGKMNRIRAAAEKVMVEEQALIALPAGPLSVRLIDAELRKK